MATILKNNIKPGGSTLKGLVATDASGNQRDVKFVRQVNGSGTATTVYDTFKEYSYGAVTINSFSYGDIPAGGGKVTPSALTYSQVRTEVGHSGATYGTANLNSGATITYSGTGVNTSTGEVSANSIGANAKVRTKITTVTVTVKLNGKSTTKTFDVYQAANVADASNKITAYGNVTCSASVADIPAGGGTVTVNRSASQTKTRTYYYTNGEVSRTATENCTITWNTTDVTATATGLKTTEKARTAIKTFNYTATGEGSKSNTCSCTAYQAANVKTKNAGAYKSYGTPTISIGSGLTAGGGSATVTAGVTDVKYYYYTYTDTSANEGTTAHYENVTGSVSLSIASQTASRYSLSGTTLSHSKMGTTTGDDSVTVRATNTRSTSLTKDATTKVTNTATAVNDGIKSYGTPTVSIGSGITAGGGSATITRSVTNVRYWHYTYTDTSANEVANARTKNEAGTVTLSIASQTSNRYSISGTTLSHTKMGTTTGDDSVTVRATNANSTSLYKDVTTKVTNTQTKNTGAIRSYGTPTVSIGTGITAAGGSATVTHGVTNTRYYYYTYTDTSANEGVTAHYENVTGTTTISITSNGNDRFSLNGNTLSHTGMGASATTDSCTITAKNSGDTSKTATATTSATNAAGTQHYKNTSGTTGDNWTYGTPSNPTLTSKLAANGGTVTISGSTVTNTKTYYLKYTSGSYGSLITETPAGTVAYEISSNGNSRFAFASGSNTTINHSNMTTNATTDTVGVKAYNTSDSTKKSAQVTASITNSYTDAWNAPSVSAFGYATSSFTYSGGTSAAPNSKTASQTGTRTFTSGSTSALSNSTFTWTYSTSSTGFSVNSSTGVVTAAANTGAEREGVITATATANGKSGTKTFTFNQDKDIANGYEYVDLGLPSGTLWAKCYVGATSPEKEGLYFAWGAKYGMVSTNSAEHKFPTADYDTRLGFSMNCNNLPSTLSKQYDTAYQNMGGNWHMPDIANFIEARNSVSWSWNYTNIGVNMPNGDNPLIFFKAAGYRSSTTVTANSEVYVWARDLRNSQITGSQAPHMIASSGIFTTNDSRRCVGMQVRGVITP